MRLVESPFIQSGCPVPPLAHSPFPKNCFFRSPFLLDADHLNAVFSSRFHISDEHLSFSRLLSLLVSPGPLVKFSLRSPQTPFLLREKTPTVSVGLGRDWQPARSSGRIPTFPLTPFLYALSFDRLSLHNLFGLIFSPGIGLLSVEAY